MARRKTEGSSAAAVDGIREQVRQEGLQAAYDALVAVCRDAGAPAPARATAATSLFRAGGLFESAETASDKPIDELTAAELDQRLEKAQARLAEIQADRLARQAAEDDEENGGPGIFD